MAEANSLTIGVMALVAQHEREAISRRTKEALAAAKARGTRLGNPNGADALLRSSRYRGAAVPALKAKANQYAENLRSVVDELRDQGCAGPTELAVELTNRGVLTARGHTEWSRSSAHALLVRLAAKQMKSTARQ